jgi:hypothetical protein
MERENAKVKVKFSDFNNEKKCGNPVLELFCDGQRHLLDAVPSFSGCGKNLIDG